MANPEKELRSLVEWLGEPWSDAVLDLGAHTHRYPARVIPKEHKENHTEIHAGSMGKGDVKPILVWLIYLRVKANDLVKRFGYEIRFLRG